jgi:hypothetical protein
MSEIVDFIKENYVSISIIVVVVLLLLVIIKIKEIDLNQPKPESKLVQQVIVETLDTLGGVSSQENIAFNPVESFCESYLGNSMELEGACNKLTEGNCAQTKCCVYTGEQCVAGGKDGPTYKTDNDGKLITIDSYYYLGKCRGLCPT